MRAMIGGEQWETYLKRILKKSKGVTGASLMRYYNANCKKKFRYGLWGPFCENGNCDGGGGEEWEALSHSQLQDNVGTQLWKL